MVKAIYRAAEEIDYDPCLVCNMLDQKSQTRLSHPVEAVRFDAAAGVKQMTIHGMEVKGIPLLFPEVEFSQYILNETGWRSAIRDGDVFFSVGGTALCSTPYVRQSRKFGSWTATLLWEDRVDRLHSAPVVERVRDRLSRPFLERIERRGFEAATPIIVLSEYTAERLLERYGIEQPEIIPYPIETDVFTPEGTEAATETDAPIVLFVGRFNDPRKNTTMLIRAFATVREQIPDAELWLIGANPNSIIRESIKNHDVTDAVTYREHVPNEDLPHYYRAADVSVIPSNQEGLAIVGLESMACGTPVVATKCGGPEQYVIDDETGYLVSRNDPDELADRIVRILSDQDLRRRLSDDASDLIQQEYRASKVRSRFQDILRALN
jgi:glycosyltransferase involved in cell wall biosynthesis